MKSMNFLSSTSFAIWVFEIAYRSKIKKKSCLKPRIFFIAQEIISLCSREGGAASQAKGLFGYFHGYASVPCLGISKSWPPHCSVYCVQLSTSTLSVSSSSPQSPEITRDGLGLCLRSLPFSLGLFHLIYGFKNSWVLAFGTRKWKLSGTFDTSLKYDN